ncbi:olfactory receptor 6N1-like [Anomaloglossus baeobatrachus]|uniref:olfactory receptor 6N1-like n=1 Tax=Anomaloglossus baeobatrachus TaxID=238106 RepID=UPI003F4F4C61
MIPGHNLSSVNEFFIVGFEHLQSFRIVLFLLLLLIYTAILAGNLLIILLVSTTACLQIPMYLFLSQLSLSDIILTSTICPNTLLVIINDGSTISKVGCLTQLFAFSMSMVTECLLLTVMSYDRYVAICKPMHYVTTVTLTFCVRLISFCWVSGSLLTTFATALISALDFCGSNVVVNHFFCDYGPLLQLSCSDTSDLETIVVIITTHEMSIETMFIFSTYVCIVRSIQKISTTTGKEKAFSTCSSHLTVVCMCFGSLIAIYVSPFGKKTSTINKILSLLYTVVTPLLNPIIYSLKNREMRIIIVKRFNQLRQILSSSHRFPEPRRIREMR